MHQKFSRCFNWLTGGSIEQTFCGRTYALAVFHQDRKWKMVMKTLDFIISKDHCQKSYERDLGH